jgi:4-amino-4-deoxy-L-arabinose transferase-like glycosyltransferase
MDERLKFFIWLLALVAMCFFWQLDAKPIHKIQELRVAETAREMVASGDWITPYFNGEIRLRKPPLAYWVAATSYTVFGEANEFTARFGSVLFAAGGAFLLFFWLRKIEGPRLAFAGAAVLVSTYLGLRYCRNAETDAMLVFFILLACIFVYRLVYQGGGRRDVLWLYLAMALGFLTKGPAAIAIPLGLWLILAIANKRLKGMRALAHPIGIPLLLVIAFGWYVYMYFKLPDMLALWVAEEIDATYVTGKHQQPIYWYALHMWKFFAPWSLFIPMMAIWVLKRRPFPPLVQWALAWFLLTFTLLTLNPSKQIQYALLLNAPLAVLVSYYLICAADGYARVNRAIFALAAVAITIVAAIVLWKWRENLTALAVGLLAVGIVLPAGLAWLLRMREAPYAVLLLAGVAAAGTLFNQVNLYDDSSDRFEVETKHFALYAKDFEPLYAYGPYPEGNAVLSFYAKRVVRSLRNVQEVEALAAQHPSFYIAVDHEAPAWPSRFVAKQLIARGDYSLWHLQTQSAAGAAGKSAPSGGR